MNLSPSPVRTGTGGGSRLTRLDDAILRRLGTATARSLALYNTSA